ncbi:MAG TPA: hypothetical protein VL098_08745 [Flavipsychrobacter sp.]|nr:hypothetical protein [Flavipsychrobacter sp.]
MKRNLLLFVSLFCFLIIAQSKNLSGNWKEVSRTDADGNPVNFKDTISISFLEGNEYTWVSRGKNSNRGTYKTVDGLLDMGARIFTIVENKSRSLILTDGSATYKFVPYTKTTSQNSFAERAPEPVNSFADIMGKWKVFKRTSDQPLKQIDYSTLLQSVVIQNTSESVGYITSSASPHEKDGWKITDLNMGTLYADGKSQRLFEISKRGEELILKEGGITYFLKRFGD